MRTTMGSGQRQMVYGVSAKGKPPVNQCLAADNSALQPIGAALPANGGVILIALLWILTALAVIALSYSKECKVELVSARNSQSLKTALYAARAAIANTIYLLKVSKDNPPVQQSTTQNTTVSPLDIGHIEGSIGNAVYKVDFQEESGKIFLNSIQEQQLRLLVQACGIPEPDSDTIVDSILDWRSPSSAQARANGAKDDYYQSLNPAYHCKNANFDTIEELLLVRGVTPDYFYGHPERDQDGNIVYLHGLSQCLTVYESGRGLSTINVNFANLAVLLSTGMSLESAQAIISSRQTQPFKALNDVTKAVPSLSANAISSLNVSKSYIYSMIASAKDQNSNAWRVIRATVNLNGTGQRALYLTHYWNENIPDYEGYAQ
jgi:general secretion pathway protein K